MYLFETLTGVFGALLFGMSVAFSGIIYRYFRDDAKLAATHIFLDNSLQRSLWYVSIGSLLFATTALLTLLGMLFDNIVLQQTIRVGSIGLFVPYMYLNWRLARSVRKQSPSHS